MNQNQNIIFVAEYQCIENFLIMKRCKTPVFTCKKNKDLKDNHVGENTCFLKKRP